MGTITMKSIYLSKKDVARKLNISLTTVSRWAKANIIPMPFSLGPNKIVWIEDELDQALEEKKKERGFLGHKPIRLVHDINETQ
jgi:predicted DNA-binding transcriptional regulator AlpA